MTIRLQLAALFYQLGHFMCQHANVKRRDVIFTYAGSREVSLVIRMELNLVGFI